MGRADKLFDGSNAHQLAGEGAAPSLVISVRQPWAWLIMNAGKDIENRTWRTDVRGRVLIHAAKGVTKDEWRVNVCLPHGIGGAPRLRQGASSAAALSGAWRSWTA